MARLPVIRASEIGEYIYCSRAWWLRRVEGLEPDPSAQARMARGTLLHRRHSQTLLGSQVLGLLAALLALAAVGLLLAYTLTHR